MKRNFLFSFLAVFAALFFVFSCSKSPRRAMKTGIYNVLDFGAVNDSSALNTKAFQKAIDLCSENGGGKVIVPPGKYLTGSVLLKSNVELHLMFGAALYGSGDSADYPHKIVVKTSFAKDGKKRQKRFGLIMADSVENIAITGFGIIDGNGAYSEHYRSYPLTDDGSKWHKPPRPKILMFYGCKNVKVHDITTINPCNWAQHYKYCDFVDIRGVKIHAHANANGDGIDLDECRDVTMSDCVLDTDDNAFILKALGTRDCENIVVSNCIFASKITAIKTGTESGGGFKDIAISNCIIRSSYQEKHFDKHRQQMNGSGIALEITDGGTMDGVVISDIVMEDCYAPFFVRLGNRGRKYSGKSPQPGAMRNIVFDNIICKNVRNKHSSTIAGFPEHYIENITFSNVRMECEGGITTDSLNPMPENSDHFPWPGMYGRDQQYPAYGLWFRHVKNLTLDNVQIVYKNRDTRPALYLGDVQGAQIVHSAFQAESKAIVQENSQNVSIK